MTSERRLCLVACAVVTALGAPRPATASGAALVGTIVGADGKPVPGATVTAVAASGARARTTTSASGEFLWTDLAPGDWAFGVVAPAAAGLADDRWTSDAPTGWDVRLSEGRVVRVVRRLSLGATVEFEIPRDLERVQDCQCEIALWKGGTRLTSVVRPEFAADSSTIRITHSGLVAANDYSAALECDGLRTRWRNDLVMPPASTTHVSFGGPLDLSTGVEGVVVGIGATVTATFVRARALGVSAAAGSSAIDPTGRFRIVDLTPGVYLLDLDGMPGLGAVAVVPGSIARVDLRLPSVGDMVPSGEDASSERWATMVATQTLRNNPPTSGGWPWLKPPIILRCPQGDPMARAGERVPTTSEYYRERLSLVRKAFEEGIPCLTSRLPKVGKAMKEFVDPELPSWLPDFLKRMWTPQLTVEFECPVPLNAPSGTCACVRPLPLSNLITFTKNAEGNACGCIESTIFHEMMHKSYGEPVECPVYQCTSECFSCGDDVPERPWNQYRPNEKCDLCKTCAEYPDTPH